ncbi:MAG: hypothetical protein ACRDO4_10155 [Nocardioides sp.]
MPAPAMKLHPEPHPSRVFVLGTGRCGTTTVIEACGHLTNFTAGHETRAHLAGEERFDYPPGHVEADNRLAWFLGALDVHFGGEPLYLHLRRDPQAVAASFERRWGRGIIGAFSRSILMGGPEADRHAVCDFYVRTVTSNIEAFLRDKPRQMTVWLEEYREWFPDFWSRVGAEGDLDAAVAEFGVRHNAHTGDARLD